MTSQEARASVGQLVRIAPNTRRNNSRHYMRGRLVGMYNDKKAVVQVFSHRGTDIVEVRHLKLWKSKVCGCAGTR